MGGLGLQAPDLGHDGVLGGEARAPIVGAVLVEQAVPEHSKSSQHGGQEPNHLEVWAQFVVVGQIEQTHLHRTGQVTTRPSNDLG